MTRQWHYVVEAKGEANEFLPTIQDAKLLAKIVSRYASASGRETWRRRESDALGGVAAKWSRGREGIGERIFGYCTRTNRALLWYLATFAISPALVAGLNALLGLSGPGSPGFPCGVTLSLNVLFFWCLWRYWTAHIQIDDQGISQAALFGKRFLAWEDVQDYFLSGDSETSVFGNVVGADGRRIRFWTSIADVEELKEGITRRAVRCREQAWEKKERQAALAKR